MEVTLAMFKADGQRRDFPLRKPVTILGRKRTCDLRIPVPSVSREHCQIEMNGKAVTLRDLGSSNGTTVNDKRVKQVVLKAGDKVTVGPVHFVVLVDGEPEDVMPVPTVLAPEAAELEQAAVEEGDEAVAVEVGDEEAVDLDLEAEPVAQEEEALPVDLSDESGEAVAVEEDLVLDDEVAPVAVDEVAEDSGDLAIAMDDEDESEEVVAVEEDVMAVDEDLDIAVEEEIAVEEDDQAIAVEADGDEEEFPVVEVEDADESASIKLAEESGPVQRAEPRPQPQAAGEEEEDPFADLAMEALSGEGEADTVDELAELAEAFPDEDEEEK